MISTLLLGLPRWLSGKECACSAGDAGLIPGLGSSPGEGNDNPLQYSCLEGSMEREVWEATYSTWGHRRVRHDLADEQHPFIVWGRKRGGHGKGRIAPLSGDGVTSWDTWCWGHKPKTTWALIPGGRWQLWRFYSSLAKLLMDTYSGFVRIKREKYSKGAT